MVYLVLEPSNGQVQAEIEKDSAETKDTVAKIMAQMADMSKDPTKSRRAVRGAPMHSGSAVQPPRWSNDKNYLVRLLSYIC